MNKVGYVYFLLNAGMPGLIKIGHTHDDIENRLKSLNTSGVPIPFTIGALFQVVDSSECEKEIHKNIASARENRRREFFKITLIEALTLSLPVISKYLNNQPATKEANATEFHLSELEEVVISSIIHSYDGYRHESDLVCKLGCDKQKALLIIGELAAQKYIKLDKSCYAIEHYILTHKGRKYAFDAGLYVVDENKEEDDF